MSVLQANATRASLEAGYRHNRALLNAAEAAIAKLETSRKNYAETEHDTKSALNRQYRG